MADNDEKRDNVLRRLLKTPPKPRLVHSAKNRSEKIVEEMDRMEREQDYDTSKLADLLGQNDDNPDPTKKRK